ncbi:MAG: DUF4157 domain-containing protein [Chloroflexi bacterium]|nr:DUF4157 domain-containing protein [Chloroflexota bacterium]
MSKPTSATEAQTDKKNRRKVQPPVVEQTTADEQLDVADAFHGGDLDAQAEMLGRTHTAQRQALALKIGQGQGNRHLQRVIAAAKQGRRAEPARGAGVQTKLTVSEPGDQYEQEADQVAETVMQTSASAPPPLPPDDGDDTGSVNRSGGGGEAVVSPDLETRIGGMKGGGKPLSDPDRTFFEDRMGADFSNVNVHTDASAAQTTRDLSARAYTTGSDIAFNKGEYEPGTTKGRHLLAHELTHVVQQGGAGALQREPDEDEVQLKAEEEKEGEAAGGNGAGATLGGGGAAVATVPTPAPEQTDGSNGSGAASATTEEQAPAAGDNGVDPAAAAEEQAPAAPAPPEAAAPGGNGADPAKEAEPQDKAPASAAEDPAFQAVTGQVEQVAVEQQTHDPTEQKSQEAQAAAEMPAEEKEGKAQNVQAGAIGAAAAEQEAAAADGSAPGFDKEAFIAAIESKINAVMPEDPEEMENIEDSGVMEKVAGTVKEQVEGGKETAQGDVDDELEEEPDESTVPEKEVTSLDPNDPGPPPSAIDATKAAPKSKGRSEVEAPLQEGSKSLDEQMAEAEVTEEQLENSNEPDFIAGLDAKKESQANAETAPQEYRSSEQGTVSQAQGEAESTEQAKTQAMTEVRGQAFGEMDGLQETAKDQDEGERTRIGDEINTIYETTQTDVQAILDQLDTDVDDAFTQGADRAQRTAIDYIERETQAYKDERYEGGLGKLQQLGDVTGITKLPQKYYDIYDVGRKDYLIEMGTVLEDVADIVAEGLGSAKDRIEQGRQEIADYVAQQPEDLQKVAQEAATDIQSKFDELEQSVDDKEKQLIESLAQQYNDNLQTLDSEIEKMKEKDKGLLDKAAEALGGPLATIVELRDMLTGVLSRVADAIKKIIADPIGFLENLIEGVKQGFENFITNIWEHLKTGFIGWLTGTLTEGGIELPETWDLKGIFQLVMQILGLTVEKISKRVEALVGFDLIGMISQIMELVQLYQKEGLAGLAKYGLEKLIGAEGMGALAQVMEIIEIIRSGDLGKLWGIIKEHLSNLKEMVIDKIKDFVVEKIVKAGITWVISLFNPAGAFIKACKMIYDVVMFFVERGKQIMALVNSVVDSVSALADGNIGVAAEAVEGALAKGIPVALGFLSSLLGLGDISGKIQEIVKNVHALVDKGLDAIFNFGPVKMVGDFIKKIVGKVKDFAQNGLKNAKKSLGFGEEDTDHQSIAEQAKVELQQADGEVEDYQALRTRKESQAKQIEQAYTSKLDPGVKLTIDFTDVANDQDDQDLDFEVVIAPNDTKVTGAVKIDEDTSAKFREVRERFSGDVKETSNGKWWVGSYEKLVEFRKELKGVNEEKYIDFLFDAPPTAILQKLTILWRNGMLKCCLPNQIKCNQF